MTNYVDYSQDEPPCYTTIGTKRVLISCGPIGRIPQQDLLYENQGDGRFNDRSEATGITQQTAGKGLAVQIVDLNRDGLLDIFVANDTTDDFLFINQGHFEFEEQALIPSRLSGQTGQPNNGSSFLFNLN